MSPFPHVVHELSVNEFVREGKGDADDHDLTFAQSGVTVTREKGDISLSLPL
jgi:hypothetical protein